MNELIKNNKEKNRKINLDIGTRTEIRYNDTDANS